MISVDKLKAIYRKKLRETGSLDAAFLKAVWIAYKTGLKDGKGVGNERNRIPEGTDKRAGKEE